METPLLSAPTPFSFILFGASGNLAKLKIYPALYVLALKKRLPEHYAIVGFARTEMSEDAFRSLVEQAVRSEMQEVDNDVLSNFLSHCHYHSGQYDNVEDFSALAKKLDALEEKRKTVRVAYLSVPPTVFTNVIENLCEGKVRADPSHFRCIVEKPVGHDLKSFEEVRKRLIDCFTEEEIYLLDHYLGKEAVRNVYYLRYANPVLERLLKNTLIDHVEITASETLGLEGRAGYFDAAGTLRDFFQSHLLLIASLLTMRLKETDDAMRESRLNALEQFYLPPSADMDDVILQGQYTGGKIGEERELGYREEEGVMSDSRTNTYIALKLRTKISRWDGVPFYMQSGKRLAKRETRISIEFQEPHLIGPGSTKNRLDIILQGEAGMKLWLQTKVGGTEPTFRPLIMEDPLICYGDCLPEHGTLLLEAIHGRQQWFLSFDEVHAAWRITDPLQAHINDLNTPLYLYPAGAERPKEADEWIAKDATHWF